MLNVSMLFKTFSVAVINLGFGSYVLLRFVEEITLFIIVVVCNKGDDVNEGLFVLMLWIGSVTNYFIIVIISRIIYGIIKIKQSKFHECFGFFYV